MDFTVDSLHSVEKDMDLEIKKILKAVNMSSTVELNENKLLTLNKIPLANIVLSLVNLVEKNINICKSAAGKIDHLKSDQILNQKKLLELQDAKLGSVQETVKSEMKSWSDIVKKNCKTTTMDLKNVKNVVKSVVEDDARTKNFIIHGVSEEYCSDMNDVAEDVTTIIATGDVKPKITATCRVGFKSNSGRPRPVKVTLASADAVNYVLARASYLKKAAMGLGGGDYSSWYLAPDRNIEERAAHKILVAKLKDMISKDPSKYHYIRDGSIHSVDKAKD